MPQPIKRHEALKPISREHHHGLLFAWKIKEALKVETSLSEMKLLADAFFAEHLNPHFEIEEMHVFPILGNVHPLVAKALDEHKELRHLFAIESIDRETLEKIRILISDHIRFEERILFPEIEKQATESQLEHLVKVHS